MISNVRSSDRSGGALLASGPPHPAPAPPSTAPASLSTLIAHGAARLDTGDLDGAVRSLSAALPTARRDGPACLAVVCASRLALAHALRGESAPAARVAGEALRLPGCPRHTTPAHRTHACLALAVLDTQRRTGPRALTALPNLGGRYRSGRDRTVVGGPADLNGLAGRADLNRPADLDAAVDVDGLADVYGLADLGGRTDVYGRADPNGAGSAPTAGPPNGTPSPHPGSGVPLAEPLTERELTVLRYLQSILSNVEIAAELCLSVNTVKTHVRNIYRKLSATRRRDAVRRARELRLL